MGAPPVSLAWGSGATSTFLWSKALTWEFLAIPSLWRQGLQLHLGNLLGNAGSLHQETRVVPSGLTQLGRAQEPGLAQRKMADG